MPQTKCDCSNCQMAPVVAGTPDLVNLVVEIQRGGGRNKYEVDKKKLHHGIVEEDVIRKEALNSFGDWAAASGWGIIDQITSPIPGAKGNVEYLLHLRFSSH